MIYRTTIKTYEIGKLCKQMTKNSVERDFCYDKSPILARVNAGWDLFNLKIHQYFLKYIVENLFIFNMLFTELEKLFPFPRKMNFA